jgi:hypothetical protein
MKDRIKYSVVTAVLLLALSTTAYASDDTAFVQAAMSSGTCLPSGDFTVVTPPEPRHDWVLVGSLCGAGEDETRVHFTGNGQGKFWVGIAMPSGTIIRDVSLDTVGLVNADPNGKNGNFEQTHLLKEYSGINSVTISDIAMNHPIGGDCVNVVGPAPVTGQPYVPNTKLTISHVTFTRCQRGGVQVSRGLDQLYIGDSTFGYTGFDVGSEGAGGYVVRPPTINGDVIQTVTSVVLTHNTFSSPASGGNALQAEWWNGAIIDHNSSLVRPFVTFGSDNLAFSFNTVMTSFTAAALSVGDRGWHISSTNDHWIHNGTAAFEAVRVSPLDKNRQSDLGDIKIHGSFLSQAAPAAALILRGVTGVALTNVTFSNTGSSTAPKTTISSWGLSPAVVVPTTGVVETGTILDGF